MPYFLCGWGAKWRSYALLNRSKHQAVVVGDLAAMASGGGFHRCATKDAMQAHGGGEHSGILPVIGGEL